MQTTTFAFLTISFWVYISCTFSTVYGKCTGPWALHACYAGNGKRSGPPEQSQDMDLSDKQFILRQLLLSDKTPLLERTPLSDRDALLDRNALSDRTPFMDRMRQLSFGQGSGSLSTDSDISHPSHIDDIESIYPDISFDREQEIEKVKTLLGELLLKRRLEDSDGYIYKR